MLGPRSAEWLRVDRPAIGNYCNDGGITILMPGADPEQERAEIVLCDPGDKPAMDRVV